MYVAAAIITIVIILIIIIITIVIITIVIITIVITILCRTFSVANSSLSPCRADPVSLLQILFLERSLWSATTG